MVMFLLGSWFGSATLFILMMVLLGVKEEQEDKK